ncbi:MAG: protein-L-isoaspartate O-methyltransferase [Flavobacteriales bacterium]|nr:protein-L-isoaspartate O-methyltransferase [Flavobacteriales bacterium]|tara:strand:- start:2209 stop:2853 length:645 start_codon:yes stop_codon:yes gene_type:complete
MDDNFRHQGLRLKLVELLREKDINDQAVLAAISKIPRHLFIDKAFLEFAYQDKAFPIGSGQTISNPYTVAYQTSLLKIKPRDKILEVGTGSGYQTAILLELKAQIYTIERQKDLYYKTKNFLPKLGYHPMFFYGDGYKGLVNFAPFDKIIVTAAAPFIPDDLINQLKIGGRMVIPVGDTDIQKMVLITKTTETDIEKNILDDCSFVPLLRKKSQ